MMKKQPIKEQRPRRWRTVQALRAASSPPSGWPWPRMFSSLLKRASLQHVRGLNHDALMTEPLSDEQLTSIGWDGRQGIGDCANRFHYYRLSDNRILFGGWGRCLPLRAAGVVEVRSAG